MKTESTRFRELIERPTTIEGLAPRPKADIVLRTWVLPSFLNASGYSVLKDNGQYFVRRVVWDRMSQNIHAGKMIASEGILDSWIVKKKLGEVEKFRFAVLQCNDSILLDGAIIGLEFRAPNLSLKMEWQSDMFEEYQDLENWIKDLELEFDKALPNNGYR